MLTIVSALSDRTNGIQSIKLVFAENLSRIEDKFVKKLLASDVSRLLLFSFSNVQLCNFY